MAKTLDCSRLNTLKIGCSNYPGVRPARIFKPPQAQRGAKKIPRLATTSAGADMTAFEKVIRARKTRKKAAITKAAGRVRHAEL